jgi:hypothetical protein
MLLALMFWPRGQTFFLDRVWIGLVFRAGRAIIFAAHVFTPSWDVVGGSSGLGQEAVRLQGGVCPK